VQDKPAEDSEQLAADIPLIVGIGASAGGLEALERFLQHVPPDSGAAFVVIQHLDPTHKGMLPELLQRSTPMKVIQAGDHTPVQPNCVYVIPPNKDLSLLHGTLHALDAMTPHGFRLPIDYFFRALAEDQREAAIGVILSGMGSDGTLGLRAIKESGGLALVQEPASAKYDAMPRSAISAGLADIVAPVEQLPGKLMDYRNHILPAYLANQGPEPNTRSSVEKIMILLRERTGSDFSRYKESTVYRRIERRMGLHQIGTLSRYVRYLQENPQEVDLLFKELLIGVTRFFRDPEAWDAMKQKGFPALFAAHPGGRALRAWVPACSSGEEAYSLAMMFWEALEQTSPRDHFSLQVFATDLDQDAIDKARYGFYPANIAADVSPERLTRFFVKEENGYRIGKTVREMVVFAPQNVVNDPPFTKLDIVTCRNLLIYLNADLQVRLIPLFHYALNRSGLLLLGSAETIGNTGLFEPLDGKARLYRRIDHPLQTVQVEFPTRHPPAAHHTMEEHTVIMKTGDLPHQAEQYLLQNFAPSAVLVTADGDIVYISGRTGKYLEPAAGKANWNIFSMARDGLRHELLRALKKVVRQGGSVRLKGLRVSGSNNDTYSVNVTVQLIDKPELLRGMAAIVFSDAPAPAPVGTAPSSPDTSSDNAMAAELKRAQDEILSIREQMQTSQEELISINEELQSTNEELQSTNEELTTSKEEMQSLNEELQTVNAELQSKVDDLSQVNNDMKNLLNSTDIAIVFLDGKLNVRRYTTQATSLFKLIASDIGRPLTDIVTCLVYPEQGPTLHNEIQDVLRTQVGSERQVATRDGRWFKARLIPYRTVANKNDGVVLTFTDITESKLREEELRQALLAKEK
jgi:chemotaxis protein methyltransferase CheR/two-component system CheB/CheR fusion protein